MASINFLLNDLQQQGFNLKKLQEIIPEIGMEIEKYDSAEIVFDITPNRSDMMDFTGFIRALKMFTNTPTKNKVYEITNKPILNLHVHKNVKKIRPFISLFIAKNINLKGNNLEYVLNFADKLSITFGRKRKKFAIGLYDFDKIKPDIFYDAAENKKFIPLGETSEMSFTEIINKHEKGIKYKDAIPNTKGKKILFPFLKDSEKILSMIPIINSDYTKVTVNTKNIMFDITGTSKKAVQQAINIFACSFIDNGAEIYPVKIKYNNNVEISPIFEHRQIKVKATDIEKKIGIVIDNKTILELLSKMGYSYSSTSTKNTIIVNIPEYRIDLFDSQDIIEDIAIAYGYKNIKPKPIYGDFEAKADPIRGYISEISRFMLGLNFSESINTYLTNEKINFENMQINYNNKKTVNILNAKTEAITILRTNLLPGIFSNLEVSLTQKMPQKLFEIGSVFIVDNSSNVIEQLHLAFVSEHSKSNFAEIKSLIDALFKLIDIANYRFVDEKNNTFIEGRCAAILLNNKKIGVFGEVDPKVLNAFRLEEPAAAAEIILKEKIEYQFSI